MVRRGRLQPALPRPALHSPDGLLCTDRLFWTPPMCFARSRYFLRVLGLSLLGREHGLGAAFVSQHDRLGETKHPQRRSPTIPFGIDRTNSSQRISRRENSFPVSRRTPEPCPPAVPAYGPVVAYGPEHASRLLLRCAPVDVHSHSHRRGAGAQLFNGSHCTPKQVSWSFKRVLGPSTGLYRSRVPLWSLNGDWKLPVHGQHWKPRDWCPSDNGRSEPVGRLQ